MIKKSEWHRFIDKWPDEGDLPFWKYDQEYDRLFLILRIPQIDGLPEKGCKEELFWRQADIEFPEVPKKLHKCIDPTSSEIDARFPEWFVQEEIPKYMQKKWIAEWGNIQGSGLPWISFTHPEDPWCHYWHLQENGRMFKDQFNPAYKVKLLKTKYEPTP